MVVGLGSELLGIDRGEELVVDGTAGSIPGRAGGARGRRGNPQIEARAGAATAIGREAATCPRLPKNGRRIRVLANAVGAPEVEVAPCRPAPRESGLLRTELAFLESDAWPRRGGATAAILAPILEILAGPTATVRLLDFGGDKTPPFLRGERRRGIGDARPPRFPPRRSSADPRHWPPAPIWIFG